LHLTEQAEPALLELLQLLERAGYDFTAVTNATHALVVTRQNKQKAATLRDVFGWSLPFAPDFLPAAMMSLLDEAGVLERQGELLRSGVRVARIHGQSIIHSAYPTQDRDAVFFSPDTYRFADFVRAELGRIPGVKRMVDLGAGPGGGSIAAAPLVPNARITLCDINPGALRLARINARHAGVEVEIVEGSLDAVGGAFDAVIANPPFMVDEESRTYRDGGDMHGGRMSLDWGVAAAERLSPGGRLLLYTGSAIVEGRDALREALEREMGRRGCSIRYREIDPDIYGEELEKPAYAEVERIAAVGAVVEKPQ
jgi:methylase of polypeptide subunit release factors